MLSIIKEELNRSITLSLKNAFSSEGKLPPVELEMPADKNHGEFATNIALKSAKIFRQPPMQIAEKFSEAIRQGLKKTSLQEKIEKIEVEKPGFINFYLSSKAVYGILSDVLRQKDDFGRSDFGRKKKVQIEFVSANPTGPLSVAHARQAAVGDALANILNFIGYKADREYYVNDEGNQINLLGKSLQSRALEILGQRVAFPENGYQGQYIIDMAKAYLKKKKITEYRQLQKIALDEFCEYGVSYLMDVIKKDLDDFGVHFDAWSYQSKISNEKQIQKALRDLGKKGLLYEKDGALWFQSTQYGDDKDRVLKKSDGTYTYLAPDIAYHKNKYKRGYKAIYNIWGPDHHGYIPRIKASVKALGQDALSLQVLIVQLATIYRNGKPVSMSTRRGEYISLREVMEEVGVDAARFFFLMRSIKAHLDFDLELAKKETPENPVYYIQYAHARIHSIVEKAKDAKIFMKKDKFELFKEEEEMDLIKKIGAFPSLLVHCGRQMDVFALVSYLMDLAACFHKFYDRHRVVDEKNPSLSSERLALIDAARIVIANGLRLIGVSSPQTM